MSEDLTVHPKITVVADLMRNMETEIALVKSGQLDAPAGNVIARFRGHQMKGLDLFLKANRLSPNAMQSQIPDVLGMFKPEPKPKRVIDISPDPPSARKRARKA
jgi:hypothetical protein